MKLLHFIRQHGNLIYICFWKHPDFHMKKLIDNIKILIIENLNVGRETAWIRFLTLDQRKIRLSYDEKWFDLNSKTVRSFCSCFQKFLTFFKMFPSNLDKICLHPETRIIRFVSKYVPRWEVIITTTPSPFCCTTILTFFGLTNCIMIKCNLKRSLIIKFPGNFGSFSRFLASLHFLV